MRAVISLDREMPFSEQYVEKYKQFAAHLLKRKNRSQVIYTQMTAPYWHGECVMR